MNRLLQRGLMCLSCLMAGPRPLRWAPERPRSWKFVPVGQAGQIDQEPLMEVLMPRTETIYLNTADGQFVDPAVRAAAREALDPQMIVEGVYEGRADLAAGLLSATVCGGWW